MLYDGGVPPLLAVKDLVVDFRSDAGVHRAVDHLSFSIEPGESFALVGESGSGKSVTSYAILRLLDPRASVAGSIAFRGEDWLQLPADTMVARRGRDAAMIFQEPMTALNPVMPVGAQVAEALRIHHPKLSRTEVREQTVQALAAVAIPEPARRYHDYPHQFSGGQRQRIVIAMALINRPGLLIADEPTTALDVTVQAQILELLRTLKEESQAALLFISHDLAVVAQVAQRVGVMRRGKIVETAPCAELFANPRHAYTRSLLAAVPTLQMPKDGPVAREIFQETTAEGELREICPGHWVRLLADA